MLAFPRKADFLWSFDSKDLTQDGSARWCVLPPGCIYCMVSENMQALKWNCGGVNREEQGIIAPLVASTLVGFLACEAGGLGVYNKWLIKAMT